MELVLKHLQNQLYNTECSLIDVKRKYRMQLSEANETFKSVVYYEKYKVELEAALEFYKKKNPGEF